MVRWAEDPAPPLIAAFDRLVSRHEALIRRIGDEAKADEAAALRVDLASWLDTAEAAVSFEPPRFQRWTISSGELERNRRELATLLPQGTVMFAQLSPLWRGPVRTSARQE